MKSNKLTKKIVKELIDRSFVRVDRVQFLSEVLASYCSNEDLAEIAVKRPEEIVSTETLNKIADDILKDFQLRTTLLCSGTNLLGKLTLYLSVPADFLAFWGQLLTMIQKLAYLYGWDSSFFGGNPTEETYARLRLILGYAMGDPSCRFILFESACDALPTVKYAAPDSSFRLKDPVMKKLLLALVANFAKAMIAGAIAKKNTLIGSGVSAAWSYASFRQMAVRIHALLRESMYYRLERQIAN